MQHPCRAARDPLEGAEDRGSKPARAGLDGTKSLRLRRWRGLQGALAVRQSRPGGALGGAVSRGTVGTRSLRGFTLIELLVAIAVMSMLAVLSWRSLDGMTRTQTLTQERADHLMRLQAALGQWSADLDAITDTQEVGSLEFDGRLLRLTRRDSGETGLHSPGIRVVAWARMTGRWMRWQSEPIRHRDDLARAWQRAANWGQGTAADPTRVTDGDSAVPIVGIDQWQLYYHRGETWGNPLSSVGNEGAGSPAGAGVALPNGVRLELTLSPGQGLSGTLVRDWVRPTLEAGRT